MTSVEKRVIEELKDIRDKPLPEPQEDWDLIWVLSGPEVTLKYQDARGRNETRDRLQTAFELARAVTSKRLGKKISDLTAEDIKVHGPKLYFNATEKSNENLRNTRSNGVLEEEYNFPRESLEIAPEGLNITNTSDQFEKFPPGFLKNNRKIVIVSSARHLPRVKRYIGLETNPFLNISNDRLIFYPAIPIEFPLKGTLREVRIIPVYQVEGFIN